MSSIVTVYHAAALFSGRETYFNAALTELLESPHDYDVILPQRDGYESGQLSDALADCLPSSDVDQAAQHVVYFLDMGCFIPRSHVVVANLDEPVDEGVVVEISYARMMGKSVVGFRTDVRSPFGHRSAKLVGIHFFPAYQCDTFIRFPMLCTSPAEAQDNLAHLASGIDGAIGELRPFPEPKPIPDAAQVPMVRSILEGAHILFDGVEDIHSTDGLAVVAQRFTEHAATLANLVPEVRNLTALAAPRAARKAWRA